MGIELARCWVTIRADTSGLTSDVQDVIPGVEGAMQDMVSNVNTAFAGINIAGPMQDAMGDLPDAIPDAMGDAKDALEKADLPNPMEPVVTGVRASGAEISQLLQGLIVKAKGLMAMVGISWGISTLVGMAKQATSAAEESINTQLRLRGLLEATGNTTGYTANQLVRMSQELRDSMNASAGSIQGVMIRLSMFGSISDEVFEKAVKASVNLSKVTGMAPESVARMIGSALENPAQGLGRLKWMGISLNKEQKEQIKNYVESGEKLKATVMLMEIIEGKSKGIAAKMALTPTGQLENLRLKLEGLRKELGVQLIPLALKFAEVGLKIQEVFNALIGGIGKVIYALDRYGVTLWRIVKLGSFLTIMVSSYLAAASACWAWQKAQVALNAAVVMFNAVSGKGLVTKLLVSAGVALGIKALSDELTGTEKAAMAATKAIDKFASAVPGVTKALEGLQMGRPNKGVTWGQIEWATKPGFQAVWDKSSPMTKAIENLEQDKRKFAEIMSKGFGEGEFTPYSDKDVKTLNLYQVAIQDTIRTLEELKRVSRAPSRDEEAIQKAAEAASEAWKRRLELEREAGEIEIRLKPKDKDEDMGKTERSVRMAFPELSNQIMDALLKKGSGAATDKGLDKLGNKLSDDLLNKVVPAIKESKGIPAGLATKT